ncbi:MAG: IclR family transcriptional regulator [Dehalococcoidales bacterium]|nr:IclR family transcriptional regulator [Dehalococcoidales bacterium]
MKIIVKAFSILDLFIDKGNEFTLDELASLSGLNKATTRRIALALIECGFLMQAEKRGKYSLGMKFLDFSGTIKQNNAIISIANPHLIELSRNMNESVQLAIWDGVTAVLCSSYHADHALKVVPDEGTRLVMHCTSLGKVMLAQMPETQLDRYFAGDLKRYTPNTITNLEDLKNHLRIVKKEGVAFDDEEYAAGIRGVGAALKSGGGHLVGAIGIVGPSVRLSRSRMRECAPVVKKYALIISRELGYRDNLHG